MRTVTIDPGEHIGVLIAEQECVSGRTLVGEDRNAQLWQLLCLIEPETIVYETFALRASAAQKLVGNKFITCEVIGVLKLYAQLNKTKVVQLSPSCKEFCGFSSKPSDPHYKQIDMNEPITEHVRDAYRLYSYAKLFKGV